MKAITYSFWLSLFLCVLLTGCRKETGPTQTGNSPKNTLNGKWNLLRLYGGITGANENHSSGEIEWTFDTQTSSLTVDNTAGNSVYYSLPSGTYSFQEISNPNGHYLVIDANELGGFVISGNQLLIDENKKSTGEGACGFNMVLER